MKLESTIKSDDNLVGSVAELQRSMDLFKQQQRDDQVLASADLLYLKETSSIWWKIRNTFTLGTLESKLVKRIAASVSSRTSGRVRDWEPTVSLDCTELP